jgi:DNA primase
LSAFCASLLRAGRIFVDFEKHAIDAGADARASQRIDVFRRARP